jgi:hypothetical protein
LKKLLVISLLFLHLFSLFGHMALYEFFVYKSDKLFNEQISMNKYSLDDLVLVKVPVKMPSIQDWKEFVCISGQVNFRNSSYNYVKARMTRDTMYLMCVPNYKKTILLNKNIIDAHRIADIPASKKEHVPFGKMLTLSEYDFKVLQYSFFTPVSDLNHTVNTTTANIVKCHLASPGQPPETLNSLS